MDLLESVGSERNCLEFWLEFQRDYEAINRSRWLTASSLPTHCWANAISAEPRRVPTERVNGPVRIMNEVAVANFRSVYTRCIWSSFGNLKKFFNFDIFNSEDAQRPQHANDRRKLTESRLPHESLLRFDSKYAFSFEIAKLQSVGLPIPFHRNSRNLIQKFSQRLFNAC